MIEILEFEPRWDSFSWRVDLGSTIVTISDLTIVS